MNYYERHIGDYLKDTAHLSLLEHGVYSRLMDVYYTREAPFASGEASRLVGARSKEERAAVESILAEFFIDGRHKRCDREIERYQARVQHNQRVGKLGGRPRNSETPQEPGGLIPGSENITREEPEPNPPSLQSPVSRKKEKAPAALVVGLESIPQDLLDEWKGVRSAKRAGKITPTVVKALQRESVKAGLSVEDAIRKCVERGWVGFEADWLKDAKQKAADVVRSTVPSTPSNGYLAQLSKEKPKTPEEIERNRQAKDAAIAAAKTSLSRQAA